MKFKNWLLLSGLIVLTVTAALQVRARIDPARSAARWVEVGDVLPPTTLRYGSVDVRLDFPRLRNCVAVVFLSPTCPACQRAVPGWAQALAQNTRLASLAISFGLWDQSLSFLRDNGIAVPLLTVGENGPATARQLGVLSVPAILIVGEGGRVRAVAGGQASLDSIVRIQQCET